MSPFRYRKSELTDLVWFATGRTPLDVWMQGLLVIAQFPDDQTYVKHIDQLEALAGRL